MRVLNSLLLALLAIPALTQAAEDPPGRVARLSHIEGEVSMAPAGTQEWGEAVLNRPLTSEDRLFVDSGARAELQIGSATIHLDSQTEFSFIDLDDDAMTMNLTEGKATIRVVRKRDNEQIEINTPNASVALLHPGEYNIEVSEEGETTIVKARSGEAEVAGEKQTYTVRANEIGVFRGSEALSSDINRIGPRTAFESWANDRSSRNERSASSRYVGEGVIGYEDLDDHGEWVSEPEYGYVWRPTYVVAGWAPYRYGRWAWVSPWGWTWIDDARWGFAPFHYGRWAYVRSRWCWVPGPRHIHAVYAPALVAWTSGPHVSVSVGFGSGIGWFPLGPREVYVPGYWHSHRYIRRVNVSNTIIVNNTYIDRAYRGRYRDFDYRYRGRGDAVTVVDREHFVRGRPIEGRYRRVDDRELRNWGRDARPPAIAPERDSLRAAQPRAPRSIDQRRTPRQVVARRELPTRLGFDSERRAIEANGGRPVARTQLIDRNPKERGDVRVVRNVNGRSVTGGAQAGAAPSVPAAAASERRADRREVSGSGVDARERAVEQRAEMRQRAERQRIENAQRENVERMQATEPSPQRGDPGRRMREDRPGSSPSTDARERSYGRRERNSSDGSEQRTQQLQQRQIELQQQRQQQQQEQSRVFEARQREQQQRDAAREAQRVQREAAVGRAQSYQRSEPRAEQPRQRSYSQPQPSQPQPRSYSQPEQRAQPRVERSAPQRSDSASHRGNTGNRARPERGGRER